MRGPLAPCWQRRQMRTKTPSWLTLYVGMAVLTALFQIWVRSSQCAGLFDCGLSYAKGIVWAAILADVLERPSRGTGLASNRRGDGPGAYDCAERLRHSVRE